MRLVSQDERVKARRESAGPELVIRERNDDALYQGLPNDAVQIIVKKNGEIVADRRPWFQLECEHWTNYDIQERSRLWKPARHMFYCDKCNGWKKAVKKPEHEPTPMEPLF